MKGSAVVARVDGTLTELDHRPTLEEAQQIVDGYIELVKARDTVGQLVTLVVNEDGKPQNLPTNKYITKIYGPSIYNGIIVGNVIILRGWKTVG